MLAEMEDYPLALWGDAHGTCVGDALTDWKARRAKCREDLSKNRGKCQDPHDIMEVVCRMVVFRSDVLF